MKKRKLKTIKKEGSITLLPLSKEPYASLPLGKYNVFSSSRSILSVMAHIKLRELELSQYQVINPETLDVLGYFTSSTIIEWMMMD